MNKLQAERILDDFARGHSNYGHGWQCGEGYYDAEFNIKIYYPHAFYSWLDDLTKEQRDYLQASEMDTLAWELECFTDLQLPEDKYPPVECWQDGRQGGWLVCRWYAPESGRDAIRLAYAVLRINKMVQTAKEYISSVEFWQDQIDANCPTPFPALFAGIGL